MAPTDLVTAGGEEFVADTGSVQIFDSSLNRIGTVSGIGGARQLAVSPDGTTIYASEIVNSEIAVINVATATVTATYATGGCPGYLAVADTTLFYSFGCSGTQGGISHIDLTTGTPADSTNPDVTGGGPVKIVYANSSLYESGTTLHRWPVTGTDTATPTLGTEVTGNYTDQIPDFAVYGNQVAIAWGANYGFTLLDATTLDQTGEYPAEPYPHAVAFSPNGSELVGGLNAPYGNGFYIWNTATGTTTATEEIPSPSGQSSFPEVVSGSVAFAADGTTAVALSEEWTDSGAEYSLVSTTPYVAPVLTPTTITLKVTGPKTYGKPAVAQIHTRAYTYVTVTVTRADSQTVTKQFSTNGAGNLTVDITMPIDSKVAATTAADSTHKAGASPTVRFTVPSSGKVVQAKGFKTVHGVVWYDKDSQATGGFAITPAVDGRLVIGKFYRLSGKHWILLATFNGYAGTSGGVVTGERNLTPKVEFKWTYTFRGDSYNTGSSGSSKPFAIA